MSKIKITITLIFLIFALGAYDILSDSFSLFGKNSYKGTHIKNKIKSTIFYVPSRIKRATELEKINLTLREEKKNSTESILTLYNYSKKVSSFKLSKKKKETILSNNNIKYQITYYDLPLLNYYNSMNKPVGYIEKYKDKILLLSGDGQLFFFNEKEIGDSNITLKRIKSNINTFDFFNSIDQVGDISIRDIEINNNNFFFSTIYKNNEDCYNLQIYKANLENIDQLEFKIFYNMKECLNPKDYKEFNIGQSGGRIIFVGESLIFSTGAFRTRIKSQDDNSYYGKILEINLNSAEAKILSKGHRNIQGLSVFKNIIISTEHGPFGGDEVNVHKNLLNNEIVPNYGWPISSYGEHYPPVVQYHKTINNYEKFIEIAPLKKSHKDFGFIEPIKYFAPGSVGISEIEFSNSNFDSNFSNDIYFGALRNNLSQYAKIYHLKFNDDFDKIIYQDEIAINKRIRDLKIPNDDNNMLLMLETTPTLGILTKIN